MSRRLSDGTLVTVLILLALVARVPGLNWGLPYVYHPDEPNHVNMVLNILKTGDLNPHWFKYPSFRIYVSVPVAIGYFLLGVARGRFGSVQDLIAADMVTLGSGTTDIPGLYLGLRCLMALFGVAGIVFLFEWGRRHWDRGTAWFAALFLALSPLHVITSHWYRPDTVLALFSGAAVLASLQLYRSDSLRDYLLCGVLVGLAASVKYNVVVLQFAPVMLAHMLARKSALDWRLWLIPVIALGVFLAITPYAILDLPAFLDGFAYEINHYYVRGHPGADSLVGPLGNAAWYVAKELYYEGLLLPLAVASPFLVERKRRAECLLLLVWVLLVLALNSSASVRTALALVPLLLVQCFLAGIAAQRLRTLCLNGQKGRKWLRLAGTAPIVVTIAFLAARTVRANAYFVRPDVRTTAREWIVENLPSDTRVMLESYGPVLRWPSVRYAHLLSSHQPAWFQAAGFEYVVASHSWTFFETPELYPLQIARYNGLFGFPKEASLRGPVQYHYDAVREIGVYRVPIPARYELSMAASDAPWLIGGFLEPEVVGGKGMRWTNGRGVVALRLERSSSYLVTVRGASMRPQAAEPARTVLLLGADPVGEHEWSEDAEEWSVTIRTGDSHDAARDRLNLTLKTNTWRPSDVLQTDDTRVLGILVEWITVERATTE